MISAILLSAGQSRRMEGENKLTKKVQGTPLIKHAVKNILDSSVDEVIIILGHQKEILEKLIIKNDKIKFAFNKDFESGIASSIKIGLNHLSKNTEAFFICLADMPLVNKNIYNLLIRSKNDEEIIIPTYKGMQGNPVLFSISMKNKINTVEGDMGAKKIIDMNKDKVLFCETNDISVTKDFNTKDSFNI